jgi:hypothetical protein
MKVHEKKCDGMNRKQCQICLKVFSSNKGTYQHNKNVKCVPPPHNDSASRVNNANNSNINGHHNTQQTAHRDVNNNTYNTNTNHITVNVFGKEDLEYLMENGNLLQKLASYGKKGIYGLIDIINEIHCNKDMPQNNNIIKPHDYGDGVYIMGENNTYEFREFEDVRDGLVESISRYLDVCERKRKGLRVKFNNIREKLSMRNMCYTVLSFNGNIPSELEEDLEIDENKIEQNETVLKGLTRKFDRSTLAKLTEFTQSNFKKYKDGTYGIIHPQNFESVS